MGLISSPGGHCHLGEDLGRLLWVKRMWEFVSCALGDMPQSVLRHCRALPWLRQVCVQEQDKVLGTRRETVFRYKEETDSRGWENGRDRVAQWAKCLCGVMR